MYIREYEFVKEKSATYNYPCGQKVCDSSDVAAILNAYVNVNKYNTERFYVFTLNTKLKITGFNVVSIGNFNSAPVHPREVFTPAINTPGTACVIVAHNHPSGDCTPSQADVEVTERLKQAGDLLGVKLLDHVIVNGSDYVSIKNYMGF